MTSLAREALQTVTNLSGSITVTLYRSILGSFDVLVHTHTDDAEALVADADDWIYGTIEQAQECFEQLVAKYSWHGCGSAPARVTPVTVGLTQESIENIREVCGCGGWTAQGFASAQRFLKKIYEANRALSERGIDWADNIHGHALV